MATEISLLNMPDVAMAKILNKCDIVSILILRKVCRDLRNFIDNTKPEQPLSKISILEPPDFLLSKLLELKLYIGNNYRRYPEGGLIHIIYGKEGDGYKTTWVRSDGNKCKTVKDKNVSDVFARDFQVILNLRAPILREFSMHGPMGDALVEKIAQCLNKNPVRAKKIAMCGDDQSQIMKLLPNLLSVETISIHAGKNNQKNTVELFEIDQIMEIKQWKQAKEFTCHDFYISGPIQKFAHFNLVSIHPSELSADSLKFLKDLFICSTSMSKCFRIFYKMYGHEMLYEVFGGPSIDDDMRQSMTWFFKGNSDSVLRISVDSHEIYFANTHSADVPEVVRVFVR